MNRTYYIKTSTPAYLADWFKLKDALAAFIRANYTDYSFDDAIKKEGEYLALEEYIYGRTYQMCKAAERQEAYSYLEGKDLCSRVTEINSYIASLGFGLMTSVGMLNTLCRMAGVPLIAENVEVGNLETFVAFAKEVVDSYFTTGPVGSVSES